MALGTEITVGKTLLVMDNLEMFDQMPWPSFPMSSSQLHHPGEVTLGSYSCCFSCRKSAFGISYPSRGRYYRDRLEGAGRRELFCPRQWLTASSGSQTDQDASPTMMDMIDSHLMDNNSTPQPNVRKVGKVFETIYTENHAPSLAGSLSPVEGAWVTRIRGENCHLVVDGTCTNAECCS